MNRGNHQRQLSEQKRQAALLRALRLLSVAQTSQAVLSRSGNSTSVSAKRSHVTPIATISTYVTP